MNTVWSDYIQSSRELYESRGLRFREDNAQTWLPMLHVKDGMEILELGCAGGLLLHQIARQLSGVHATGIDRDTGHIAFAQDMTEKLGLDCRFLTGDATALPFPDNSFDVTISHTVVEHVKTQPFLREQQRVLKPGGRIVVLSVRTKLNLGAERWKPVGGEEQRLFEKLWAGVDRRIDKEYHVGDYEMSETDYPKKLEEAGFAAVDVQFFTLVSYAPDNASVSDALAERQINEGRLSASESIRKALRRNPNALDAEEQEALSRLMNARYDERLAKYRRGEKLWDMETSTVLSATGVKL